MPQKRFHTHSRPLESFPENQRFLGVLQPGVYAGFDAMSPKAGMDLDIIHSQTGIKKVDELVAEGVYTGVIVTRQGIIIHEEGPITLSPNVNGNSTDERIDLVIVSHEYLDSPGGAEAQYSIIQGTAGNGEPSLSDPEKQILIGKLTIPKDTNSSNDVTYEPVGRYLARLDLENRFTKTNTEKLIPGLIEPELFDSNTKGRYPLSGSGNIVSLGGPNPAEGIHGLGERPEGTRMIALVEGSSVYSFINNGDPQSNSYLPFRTDTVSDIVVLPGDTLFLVSMRDPISNNRYWKVSRIDSQNTHVRLNSLEVETDDLGDRATALETETAELEINKANVQQPAWTKITLNSNFIHPINADALSYYISTIGIVHIKGLISNTVDLSDGGNYNISNGMLPEDIRANGMTLKFNTTTNIIAIILINTAMQIAVRQLDMIPAGNNFYIHIMYEPSQTPSP